MRMLALMLLLMPLLALVASCGEEEATGPDAAVQKFIGLLNSREFDQAYDSLAENSPYREMTRNEFIQDNERYFPSNAVAFRLSDFRASEVAIVDDEATVSWSGTWAYGMKGETGDTITVDSTVEFEDGVWRVLKIWGD